MAALTVTAGLVVGAPAAGASTFPAGTIPTGLGIAFPLAGNGALASGAATIPAGLGTASLLGGNGALASGLCGGTSTAGQGQGGTGGTTSQHCLGAGLSFTGPAIGQISTVIGPTIISPAVVGASIVVSAGNGAAAP